MSARDFPRIPNLGSVRQVLPRRAMGRVGHGRMFALAIPAARDVRGNGRKANRRSEAWPKVREPA